MQERLLNLRRDQLYDRARLMTVSTKLWKIYLKENKKRNVKSDSVAIDWVTVERPLTDAGADEVAIKWCHETLQLKRPADVIAAFARRIFRRPPTSAEVQRYAGMMDAAIRDGLNRKQALQSVLAALLVFPSFLFRKEFAIDEETVPEKSDNQAWTGR